MKVFCMNDALDEQVFMEMNNNTKYKLTKIDTNWDVAGRYRVVFWVEEYETVSESNTEDNDEGDII